MHRIAIALAATCLAILAYSGVASAAVFGVNSTVDTIDIAPGNGVCADAAGRCTLRAAVMEANALPGWDDIKVPTGTYPLTLFGAGEDAGLTGDLDIRSDAGIYGDGPRRTVIDGQQADRVFDTRSASVAMSGLGVRNGVAVQGGGIRTQFSKLHMRWAALYINSAPTVGATLGAGAGVYSYATTLTLSGVSLFSNRAAEMGGGVYVATPATIAPLPAGFENVTISGNSARRGGGLFAHTVPALLRNLTIANNSSALGGGIYWLNLQPRSFNTTVAYNAGQDCSNPIVSAAHNNDTDMTCGFFAAGDLPGVDPLLGPLTYLGVALPNWVRTLNAGSPLRDTGDPATCLGSDEVGQPRPIGAICDIGAYEQP